ncbi:hypothetical protein EDB80DRAFT_690765 [Ilyonectria destructans]|nr:hypothetical protein EDB80DRAFT_690765 [Ilyonectria destructans]
MTAFYLPAWSSMYPYAIRYRGPTNRRLYGLPINLSHRTLLHLEKVVKPRHVLKQGARWIRGERVSEGTRVVVIEANIDELTTLPAAFKDANTIFAVKTSIYQAELFLSNFMSPMGRPTKVILMVAVFGAGPVGLLIAYAAFLRCSAHVYVVDRVQQRLDAAASIGPIPINFAESDPVAQILEHEPDGVRRVVDAAGNEAVHADGKVDPGLVVRQAVQLAHIGGGIGQGGPVDVKLVASQLVSLIASGNAKPGFVSTAEIGIEEAPEYYRRFDDKEEVKTLLIRNSQKVLDFLYSPLSRETALQPMAVIRRFKRSRVPRDRAIHAEFGNVCQATRSEWVCVGRCEIFKDIVCGADDGGTVVKQKGGHVRSSGS